MASSPVTEQKVAVDEVKIDLDDVEIGFVKVVVTTVEEEQIDYDAVVLAVADDVDSTFAAGSSLEQ